MTNYNSLNHNFSTTRLLINAKPNIEKRCRGNFDSVLALPKTKSRVAEGGLRLRGYFKVSHTKKPLLSIVTVVYNGEVYLEETIRSVITQNYDNVEYIIIDGGSTDRTLAIIKKYDEAIDYWVSESDLGISDAFNKGIRCCSGELIGLINADDYYEENAFGPVINNYISNQRLAEMVIYGKTYKITIDGVKKIKNSSRLGWWLSAPFSHCSSFLTIGYYRKYGLFNNNYKVGMDVDLLIRGIKSAHYIELYDFIATQRDGGVSDQNRLVGYREYRKIVHLHFGYILSNLGHIVKLAIHYKNKVFR